MSLAPGTTPPVDTLGHKHHDLRMHQPPPAAVLSPDWLPTSPRLYNQDLAPHQGGRTAVDRLQLFHALG